VAGNAIPNDSILKEFKSFLNEMKGRVRTLEADAGAGERNHVPLAPLRSRQ